MNRKNRVRIMIIVCMILICAALLFAAAENQKTISEDAVLVRVCEILPGEIQAG